MSWLSRRAQAENMDQEFIHSSQDRRGGTLAVSGAIESIIANNGL